MKKYDYFCKALNNLSEGAKTEPPYSILEQTGIVALFSICFEQTWKLIKQILEDQGLALEKIASPRKVIKSAYQFGIIKDEQPWLELLETRNILANTYDDNRAQEPIEKIKTSYLELFIQLKQEIDENWIIDDETTITTDLDKKFGESKCQI